MYDNYFATSSYDYYVNCEIIDVPKMYFPVQFAYTIQKNSPYFDALWFHMAKLKENGVFNEILNNDKPKPQMCPDYSGMPLALGQCFTAMMCLAIGGGMGLLILM